MTSSGKATYSLLRFNYLLLVQSPCAERVPLCLQGEDRRSRQADLALCDARRGELARTNKLLFRYTGLSFESQFSLRSWNQPSWLGKINFRKGSVLCRRALCFTCDMTLLSPDNKTDSKRLYRKFYSKVYQATFTILDTNFPYCIQIKRDHL